ncbi:MAG: ATP-binding protein [Desulfobacterales bacterium]
MNIAIVGTGGRCIQVLDFLTSTRSGGIGISILGVADSQMDPNCVMAAGKSGIPVSADYRGFLKREDIDLIIDLSGDPATFQEILAKKNPNTRLMNYPTARLFLDMCRIHEQQPGAPDSVLRASTIYKIVMNDFIHEDVLVIAPNFQILDANDALLKRLGHTREEVIGRSCFEVTHHYSAPCAVDSCQCPLKQTLDTLKPFTTTHVHLDKDGGEHHVAISCYPLVGPEGVVGAIEISKDITRDIVMQRSLLQQEKLASIGRLSAGVAHEINNPLTTVLTTVMLLQEDLAPEDPLYAELETIAKETLRCRKIVSSLLDFARQSNLKKETTSVNPIVAESVALARKQAGFKGIQITPALADGLPDVLADRNQLHQAFINLLVNGIEATPAGGSINVATFCDPEQKEIRVVISDTGSGMPKDVLEKIFEPFYTTKPSGTGLGLAITHGIIEQHGGRIDVDSAPGQGTTFMIILPATGRTP